MNNSPQVIQEKAKAIMQGFCYILSQAMESYERYWGTSANTDIASLGDTDPVTVSSKLTKAEFVAGITLAEAITKFVSNQEVTNAQYINTARKLTLGDNPRESVLTQEVESIGDKLMIMGSNIIEIRQQGMEVLNMYNATEMAAACAVMSDTTVFFGSSLTTSHIIAGMNMVDQFLKLCDGNSPAQGDYMSILLMIKSFF